MWLYNRSICRRPVKDCSHEHVFKRALLSLPSISPGRRLIVIYTSIVQYSIGIDRANKKTLKCEIE